ncbi:uncharacterized protein CANTADRAFT_48735 [Suhomyces tanzawaensis NRRL Y-17324]|uniref:Uncharacterized protein n=1 Tax=Suhomyces tanzawaensis NRRL Y-17324 TaxID=984487 RepID=A0A1E4SKE8_9ASCO|nr:uncharacterized protein CANTADRAFT_48735 [Suhomyces tanzawaensis NRRL Y-17324]ODV79902.1 hypothetical protein CANTADRAFT_48735 [Suhomyces tanzawaensis NRRL Y-17324]
MYSPNLFTNDLYKLWTHDSAKDSIKAFEEFRNGGSNKPNEPPSSQPSSSARSNEQLIEEQRKYLRLLFAPPLLAYSADIPGASLSQLEYTIQNSASLPGLRPSVSISALEVTTTPLTQLKMHQLEQIQNTGYSTIRPIGIHRTMEEIEFDEARRFNTSDQQIDDQSYIHTAENTNTEGQGAGVNGSNVSMRDVQGEEVDLDAEVRNMDDEQNEDSFADDSRLDSYEDEADLRIQNQERANLVEEGFMADEVEYQDDHSLAVDNIQMLMNSGTVRSSLMSTLDSGASLATNVTSLTGESGVVGGGDANFSSARECVGQENDEDQSDLDMVIEE